MHYHRAHSGKLAHNPEVATAAINMLACGAKQTDVGKMVGCHASAVSVWSRTEDIKKKIEVETARVLSLLPNAVDYAKATMEDGAKAKVHPHMVEYEVEDPETGKKIVLMPADPKAVANAIKLRGLGYDVARDILKSAGILPSHTESRTVIAILSGDAAETLAPALSELMGQMIGGSSAPEAIDITPEDEG